MAETIGPQVDELDERLAERYLEGQWEFLKTAQRNPQPTLDPYVWEWDDIETSLHEAKSDVDVEDLTPEMRRSLSLVNPALDPLPSPGSVSRTIHIGFQIIEPGEVADPHRHTATAFRFGIEGNDEVVTIVNGERFKMKPGDLILTPRMTWHEHENRSDETAIWLDGLDASLIAGGLGAIVFEQPDADRQKVERPDEYSARRFATLSPAEEASYRNPDSYDNEQGSRNAPPYRFAWKDAYAALQTMAKEEESYDPYNGTYLEYVNPATGTGPVFETLSLRLQMLRDGESTESHRHSSAEYYYVHQGSGSTEIGEETYEWNEGDSFIVPPMTWHAHRTDEDETILFVTSDQPVHDSFNVHRVEER